MTRKSRYGSRWLLVLFGALSWLSIGCNPQMLTMFLMPFQDGKKDPEYKVFADSKEIKLVVLSHFDTKPFQPELIPAEQELATSVCESLRERCTANKHTLKLIPQVEVRNFQLRQLSEDGAIAPLEIGKKFKADFVLDLSIEEFDIYQKRSVPRLYYGSTQVNIKLYKLAKDDNSEVFSSRYRNEYNPNKGVPLEVGNSNPAGFRNLYLKRVSRDISRMFIAFDPDELKSWE
jgi:hypothetical protein